MGNSTIKFYNIKPKYKNYVSLGNGFAEKYKFGKLKLKCTFIITFLDPSTDNNSKNNLVPLYPIYELPPEWIEWSLKNFKGNWEVYIFKNKSENDSEIGIRLYFQFKEDLVLHKLIW